MATQPTSPTGSRAGFTLLELMLAITIGGMVLTAVYSMFSAGIDTQRRVARVASQTQAWRFYSERLRTDLRNLLIEEQTLSGDRNTLTLQLANAAKIRYERRATADEGQVRRIELGDDDAVKAEAVVYEGAKQLSFRYFEDGQWRNEPTAKIPRAVECELQDDQGTQRLVVALEVESADE